MLPAAICSTRAYTVIDGSWSNCSKSPTLNGWRVRKAKRWAAGESITDHESSAKPRCCVAASTRNPSDHEPSQRAATIAGATASVPSIASMPGRA
ncbi:MAG: hypothetical protein JF591_04325 [Lysobacter sp.]|nr:hypothetical protein [Lysobacter sp.]